MGFHKDKIITESELLELEELINKSQSGTDVRRLQSVYFRAKFGYDAKHISELTQYSIGHIKRIWSKYFKEGAKSLLSKPRGGRNNALMDIEEEEKLLSRYVKSSKEGQILEVAPLHKDLCEHLGKKVAVSTAYRLLKRHGWRKIAPRPFHPNRNSKSAEYFKLFFPQDN